MATMSSGSVNSEGKPATTMNEAERGGTKEGEVEAIPVCSSSKSHQEETPSGIR